MSYHSIQIICDEDQADMLSAQALDHDSVGTSYEDGQLTLYFQGETAPVELLDLVRNLGLKVSGSDQIADRNWNALWEENFHDLTVGDIHVRAPFHSEKGMKHEIVIHPKMAFGTGHHGTTQLMLKAMMKHDFQDRSVLDMGCGSGILAILASQKGARSVLAIDYDIYSVENSLENVQLNGLHNVEVVQADTLDGVTTSFDIILSNIVKNVNLGLLQGFASHLNPNGLLLLCGLLREDLEECVDRASALNLKLIDKDTQDEWLQLTFQSI